MSIADGDVIKRRVASFVVDLHEYSPIEVVRKDILSGTCFALDAETEFALRSEVARHFGVHPNEVFIVGSAKLGFSIVPSKRFRPFCDCSDIDLVLVSSSLFDNVWKEVFLYSKNVGYWEKKDSFTQYLFKGWIRPDKLPTSPAFSLSKEWWEFFRGLTSKRVYGDYKIAAGLYKSLFFLESYQEICASGCKEGVAETNEYVSD